LPMEAEWEYACRAGAETSRYYGRSLDLLGRYAWYNATSQDRAWPCGSLLPNDLGLFDMLGNVFEWGQEVPAGYSPDREGKVIDSDTIINEYVDDNRPRLLRSGSFDNRPAIVRSADCYRIAPAYRDDDFGFRLSRTYP
jgi:sulfatase modifying factor 1